MLSTESRRSKTNSSVQTDPGARRSGLAVRRLLSASLFLVAGLAAGALPLAAGPGDALFRQGVLKQQCSIRTEHTDAGWLGCISDPTDDCSCGLD